jgi:hypothetical protein
MAKKQKLILLTEAEILASNNLDFIEYCMLELPTSDPLWDILVLRRNQILVKLEHIRNPVFMQSEKVQSLTINKYVSSN